MRIPWYTYGLALLWAQDSIQATAYTKGDFVEVAFEWKGNSGTVPLAANFVLIGRPASALAWQIAEVSKSGRWDALRSPLYQPLYITARPETIDQVRISLNLICTHPPAGEPLAYDWETIGAWRIPIIRFGDTLHLSWSMETGEIVLAPFIRAKGLFTYVNPQPVILCPKFPPLHIKAQETGLSVEGLSDFRSENLTIQWYRDGIFLQEGESFMPSIEGSYYAEVLHSCGTQAKTDTFYWRNTSVIKLEQRGWRVYPNPNNGILWIEAPASTFSEIKLWDGAGRCLLERREHISAEGAYRMVLPSLPAGLYRLTLTTEKETLYFPLSYAP
ncbi:MAG: T9SS type A sorting domain-containing protein [Bacteroidia bacterium]|nr:T9SS type A sorting domain-containing protein [Bacteroidia bacterium]